MSELLELKDSTLIDMLLREQGRVDTPVGRFADQAEARGGDAPYQGLIPLSAPKAGEQFAFEVNLDKCSGCKGCVTACHSLNGLDENETWRDVGLLVGGSEEHPFQQTVTTACHHCVDPGCMNGCPVNAYEKDPISGVVLHLDDQCIGCQYCVLKCPYDVPKYSEKRGIVRKCDMCHSRLSEGEAPACVQACPHEAIKIVTVDKEERIQAAKDEASFLPDSPDPDYTVPTTRFVTKKKMPLNAHAADKHVLRPQHTHWPLVGLLALSQLGVGGFLVAAFFGSGSSPAAEFWGLALSWGILHLGLACSVLHLGQPLKAWRIFLGFRKSWLSREALALGGVSGLASAALGLSAYGLWFGSSIFGIEIEGILGPLLAMTAALGLVGVLTSVYIYVDTKRSFWRMGFTAAKFYGSVVLGCLALGVFVRSLQGEGLLWVLGFGMASLAKLGVEFSARSENEVTLGMSRGPLAAFWKGRIALGLFSGLALPVLYAFFPSIEVSVLILAFATLSEVVERAFYFKAVNAPKMPGSVTV
ncbi:MAG: DmsC/YnfH family molybdoenzyme membrane anchor subunit [Verrucomicrobiota bacterium]